MSHGMIEHLAKYRQEIDDIDVRILQLLNERTQIVERIGAIKRELAMPIYEPKREEQVLTNVSDHNQGPLPPDAIRRIFERVMDEMRNLQKLRVEEAQKQIQQHSKSEQ
jgi:chorismate mutase